MNATVLTINSQRFDEKELRQFSGQKLQDQHTASWEKDIYRFILDWLDPSQSIIQYSSGTTGKSKKLQLLKKSMLRSAANTCRYIDLKKDQSALLCLPVEYIAGKMMVVRSIVAGLNLQMIEPKSRLDFSGIPSVDFSAMVPLQLTNLLKDLPHFPGIKKILVGGTEITPELVNQLNMIPAEVFASFGMAETCSHVALRRLNGPGHQDDYHALPEVILEQDERGCLVIVADYLPQKVVTNDLVQFTSPGSFIWLGRFDNLINSGGIKVVPEELEKGIRKETGLECAIIGLPDKKLGQRLILVAEKSRIATKEPGLRSSLRKLLPSKLTIRDIVLIDKLPRNPALKLDRRKLAEMVSPML
jgi:O-succinylbenzoic acid--CoA ligase